MRWGKRYRAVHVGDPLIINICNRLVFPGEITRMSVVVQRDLARLQSSPSFLRFGRAQCRCGATLVSRRLFGAARPTRPWFVCGDSVLAWHTTVAPFRPPSFSYPRSCLGLTRATFCPPPPFLRVVIRRPDNNQPWHDHFRVLDDGRASGEIVLLGNVWLAPGSLVPLIPFLKRVLNGNPSMVPSMFPFTHLHSSIRPHSLLPPPPLFAVGIPQQNRRLVHSHRQPGDRSGHRRRPRPVKQSTICLHKFLYFLRSSSALHATTGAPERDDASSLATLPATVPT